MKSIQLLLYLLLTVVGVSQKISNIDFDLIKKETQDSESNHFYPKLIERFIKADTTLDKNDFAFIYYGNVYTDGYNPYGATDAEDKFLELYNKKKYKKAIPHGEKVLEENPVNLKISFKMLVCHNVLEDTLMAKHYARRYFPLLDCIFYSGDGASIETAYVVINVKDEYEMLADLRLSMVKQALVGNTDVLTINTKNQKVKEGYKKIETLHFNVSRPLQYLSDQFKK